MRIQILDRILDTDALLSVITYNPTEPILFNSGFFLWLFLGFTLIYALLHKYNTMRLLFVTAFSYYFYYKSSGIYFALLAFVTISDWLIARQISRQWDEEDEENSNKTTAKWLLALSIIIDLALLGYFKYTNFLIVNINQIFASNFQLQDIFLPVGISFFTFQSMSYTIDVYRRKIKPLSNPLDYAFFVSFFPQLVAGPIVKAKDFIPQIRRQPVVSRTMFATGVWLIVAGLIKKAVISDYISINFVERIFDNPSLYSGVENLLGLYGYTIQIYCDFSGYSDMAIGIALLLGFRFPMNFNSPYTSASIAEFWRRWHISLSTWLRDYLYIPMGGSRCSKARTYFNSFFTMLVCGIWHGAGLNYVLWGIYHGLAVACNKFFSDSILKHDKHYRSHGFTRFVFVFLTFHVVVVGWMMFRLQDPEMWPIMLNKILMEFHPELLWNVVSSFYWVFILITIGFITHWIPEKYESRLIALLSRQNIIVHALIIAIAAFIVIQVKNSEVQPFIYFQF